MTHSTAGRMVGLFPLDLVGWELPPAGWRCSVAEERDLIASEVREQIAREIEAERDARVPWPPSPDLMSRGADLNGLILIRATYDTSARIARGGSR